MINNDTIAAIATGPGTSGIGIIRISGPDALKVADKVFISAEGKKPSGYASHTLHYGWVYRPHSKKGAKAKRQIIDEAMLGLMRAPRSYTREDVVELNCHGGVAVMRLVLESLLENGCRMAEPGEFTRRAFLNGRIDLSQAEAVMDTITAGSESALRTGIGQLRGGLSRKVRGLKDKILNLQSILEAGIDFPGEDTGQADNKSTLFLLKGFIRKIEDLLQGAAYGRKLREGATCVICGKPNVGKSSLLNALLLNKRALVSSSPGTTRDTIEETTEIEGIPFRLIDTAGLGRPAGKIETEAMLRTRESMRRGDILLLVFDASKPLSAQDKSLLSGSGKNRKLVVINKSDLHQRIEKGKIAASGHDYVEVSAKKHRNLAALRKKMSLLATGSAKTAWEPAMVSNIRHIDLLKKAQKLLAGAVNSADNNLSAEFICQDLREAVYCLEELLGERSSVDLLERIFSRFCIGK